MPYGAAFAADWERTMATKRNESIDDALAFHAYGQDPEVLNADRFVALSTSLFLFQQVCDEDPSGMRLSSLARVARELGIRTVTIKSLTELARVILQDQSVDPSEPFLAPNARFDTIAAGEAPGNWILGGVLEELERSNAWSSYYRATPDRLRTIRDLGFASSEMLRRIALVQERHDRSVGQATP